MITIRTRNGQKGRRWMRSGSRQRMIMQGVVDVEQADTIHGAVDEETIRSDMWQVEITAGDQ